MNSPLLKPEQYEELKQMMFGIMCFRLGGEVSITAEDIKSAGDTISSTQVLLVPVQGTDEHKVLLKTRLKPVA